MVVRLLMTWLGWALTVKGPVPWKIRCCSPRVNNKSLSGKDHGNLGEVDLSKRGIFRFISFANSHEEHLEGLNDRFSAQHACGNRSIQTSYKRLNR